MNTHKRRAPTIRLTFKHVLDEHAALNDILLGRELFIIGGDKENHFIDRELAR